MSTPPVSGPSPSTSAPASDVAGAGLRVLKVAAAYALLAWISTHIIARDGNVAPLYPPAGLAVVAVLVFGRRGALGVLLGGIAHNLVSFAQNSYTGAQMLLPWVIGAGGMLQALLAAALIRRVLPDGYALRSGAEVLRFMLAGGAVAGIVNPGISLPTMWATGLVQASDLPFLAWTWWSGDLLGVMAFAPVMLTLWGRPREDWRPRKATVAAPLLLLTLLLTPTWLLFNRWERERQLEAFDLTLRVAADALQSRLADAVDAVLRADLAMRRRAASGVSATSIADAPTEPTALRAIPALLWAAWVPVTASAPGATDPHAQAQTLSTSQPVPAAVLQSARVQSALREAAGSDGVRLLTVPEPAAADLSAGAAAAPRPLLILIGPSTREMPTAGDRRIVAALSPQTLLDTVARNTPAIGRWCLKQVSVPADGSVTGELELAGDCSARTLVAADGAKPDTARPDNRIRATRMLRAVDRQWSLSGSAITLWSKPSAYRRVAGLMSLISVAGVGTLGMLLLMLTGRTRRIELAVQDRTHALRASETRLRSVLDQTPIGLATIERDGTVIDCNPALCQMVGLDEPRLIGTRVSDLAAADDRPAWNLVLQAFAEGHIHVPGQIRRLARRRGEALTIVFSAQVLPRPGSSENSQQFLGVFQDLTERLRTEQAEQALDAARSANLAKTEFVSRMSHELRTPLNAVLGFAQLLELDQSPPLSPTQRAWAAQIQSAGWHLMAMIADTLDLARIEAGQVRFESQSLDPAAVALACVEMVRDSARQRNITIEVDRLTDGVRALGDETRIKQILTNLLSNAIKYNRPCGRVRVSIARARGERVKIVVADTGLGMDEQQLSRLFQPYDRLGREASEIEGTGIGLVISRRLAELMGGSLQAESRAGEGSRFTLRLPSPSREPDDSRPGALADPALPTILPRYAERAVLYVEDNEVNALVMRGILAARPQIALTVVPSLEQAREAMAAQTPDLVLLDMHLPDGDGLELLQAIKADPRVADIPVIVVSADAMPTRVEQALTGGAQAYLTKPLQVPSVLHAVDAALHAVDSRMG